MDMGQWSCACLIFNDTVRTVIDSAYQVTYTRLFEKHQPTVDFADDGGLGWARGSHRRTAFEARCPPPANAARVRRANVPAAARSPLRRASQTSLRAALRAAGPPTGERPHPRLQKPREPATYARCGNPATINERLGLFDRAACTDVGS